jgi:hypothetical protein
VEGHVVTIDYPDYILRGEAKNKLPALKVPWQCPLVVLQVKVDSTECKTLESEEGKVMGSELHYEQRKEVEQGLY